MADTLRLSLPAVAFAGLGVLLATNVLTLEDINLQGSTLVTFFWLAVLFALSGQLNELGFMGYVGGKLTALLGGVAWPIAYVVLLVLYVLMHVREPVGAGARALRRIPRCRRAHRCPHISDGIRAAVCQQLLLDDYSARGKSERHFCWQQLLDSGRALASRVSHYILLPSCVSGAGDAVVACRMTSVDNVTTPRDDREAD